MTRCTHVWHQRGKSLQQNAFIAQEWRQSVSNRLKPCPHCRRKVRLSPNEFGDSLTFLWQCGRCLTYLRLGVSQLGLIFINPAVKISELCDVLLHKSCCLPYFSSLASSCFSKIFPQNTGNGCSTLIFHKVVRRHACSVVRSSMIAYL